MSDAVIGALITAAASVVLQVILAIFQNKSLLEKMHTESLLSDAKLDAKLEKYQAVQAEKIEELSRRVEKHNQIVDRTYVLEKEVAKQGEQIKTLFNRKTGT